MKIHKNIKLDQKDIASELKLKLKCRIDQFNTQ